MYLFILDDGQIFKQQSYSKEDLAMVDRGLMQLIDIRKPADPVEYFNDKWSKILDAEELE